jgi:hypothetical protein
MFSNIYFHSHVCSKSMKLILANMFSSAGSHIFRIIFCSGKYSSTLKNGLCYKLLQWKFGSPDKILVFVLILKIISNSRLKLKMSFSHMPNKPKCISINSAVSEIWNRSGQWYTGKWLISDIMWVAEVGSVAALLINSALLFCLHCIPTVDALIYYIYFILHNFCTDLIFIECRTC